MNWKNSMCQQSTWNVFYTNAQPAVPGVDVWLSCLTADPLCLLPPTPNYCSECSTVTRLPRRLTFALINATGICSVSRTRRGTGRVPAHNCFLVSTLLWLTDDCFAVINLPLFFSCYKSGRCFTFAFHLATSLSIKQNANPSTAVHALALADMPGGGVHRQSADSRDGLPSGIALHQSKHVQA